MRCLVLAHPEDTTALRVTAALRRRVGVEKVRLVSAESLALAPSWRHRLNTRRARSGSPGKEKALDLQVESQVRLANGEELTEEVKVVFNRLCYAVLPQFEQAGEVDRNYAAIEMFALLLSWLASLQSAGVPMINPPSTRGLGAQRRSRFEWLALAGQAGMPAVDLHLKFEPESPDSAGYRLPSLNISSRALAAGKRLLFDSPETLRQPGLEQAIQRMQELCACPLLELTFARQDDEWRLFEANAFPTARTSLEIEAISEMLLQV